MERRKFIACAICAMGTGPVVASHPVSRGCFLIGTIKDSLGIDNEQFSAAGNSSDPAGLDASTGDAEADKLLGRALARMAQRFGVAPAFSFYREKDKPNAYATKETTTSGTWGSVVFGRKLFEEQFARYKDGGISVVAIMAHEFGHIVQYRNDLERQLLRGEPTVRRMELHADYLAGWYLGLMKQSNSNVSLWASGDTFKRIGDFAYNDPGHHGTPEQRVAATEAGFEIGRRGAVSNADAVDSGLIYMRKVRLD